MSCVRGGYLLITLCLGILGAGEGSARLELTAHHRGGGGDVGSSCI